jgi:hypothetical protein
LLFLPSDEFLQLKLQRNCVFQQTARAAVRAISSDSCSVKMIVCVLGARRRINGTAVKPSSSGIAISSRITSGLRAAACSTASNPFVASPQIIQSWWDSIAFVSRIAPTGCHRQSKSAIVPFNNPRNNSSLILIVQSWLPIRQLP